MLPVVPTVWSPTSKRSSPLGKVDVSSMTERERAPAVSANAVAAVSAPTVASSLSHGSAWVASAVRDQGLLSLKVDSLGAAGTGALASTAAAGRGRHTVETAACRADSLALESDTKGERERSRSVCNASAAGFAAGSATRSRRRRAGGVGVGPLGASLAGLGTDSEDAAAREGEAEGDSSVGGFMGLLVALGVGVLDGDVLARPKVTLVTNRDGCGSLCARDTAPCSLARPDPATVGAESVLADATRVTPALAVRGTPSAARPDPDSGMADMCRTSTISRRCLYPAMLASADTGRSRARASGASAAETDGRGGTAGMARLTAAVEGAGAAALAEAACDARVRSGIIGKKGENS
jgi:hypothetical protein